MVSVEYVDASGREALRSLLSDYLIEFAAMEGVPVAGSADVPPQYRWFDQYWLDADRLPFAIHASEGETAGFCLIRVMDGGWNIAEFGIRREWRRRGIGRRAVTALAAIASSAGATHLRADVADWNDGALRFWLACGFRQIAESDGVATTRRVLDPPG